MTDKFVESRTNMRTSSEQPSMEMLATAALDGLKAQDIQIIPLKNSYADKLVIATGTSDRHVQALLERTVEYFGKAGIPVDNVEGTPNNKWVIADFGDLVIHIFTEEMREMYRLEKLYSEEF